MNTFKKYWQNLNKSSKKYTTGLDMYIGDLFNGRHGEDWFTGQVKSFTDSEIEEIKRKKGSRASNIEEYDDSPKRFVDIVDSEGNTKRMTWGEYLSYRRKK